MRDAALSLGDAPDDAFQKRLREPAPELDAFTLEHTDFAFERPDNLEACLDILESHPDATLIAGATDLAVEANLRGRRWPLLVSVEALPELRVFDDGPEQVEIGAALPLSEIESRWTGAPPVLREWFPLFASPLIRNRATLGGNLATASPVGDAAPLLLALDANVTLAGMAGRRSIPLSEFFLGYRETAMLPGEILLSVSIPKPFAEHAAFFKVAKRTLDDISTVAAAYAIELDGAGWRGACAHCLRRCGRHTDPRGGGRSGTDRRKLERSHRSPGTARHRSHVATAVRSSRLCGLPSRRGANAAGEIFSPDRSRGGRMSHAGRAIPHESATAHVTGGALYTDDLQERFPGLLHAWPVLAPHAHAELTRLDPAPALLVPGVVTVLTLADIPGEGDCGPVRHDEPIFSHTVQFHGQPVAWVLAESLEAARLGALAVAADFRPLEAILSIEAAITAHSFHSGPLILRRAEPGAAMGNSQHQRDGEIQIGGQEPFSLETQATVAWLDPAGGVTLQVSTQHPAETQEIVARVLGVARSMVTVECNRMGGAIRN